MRYPNPAQNFLKDVVLTVRVAGREAFKFMVIPVEGNQVLLADLAAVPDHILNEQSQFIQERPNDLIEGD